MKHRWSVYCRWFLILVVLNLFLPAAEARIFLYPSSLPPSLIDEGQAIQGVIQIEVWGEGGWQTAGVLPAAKVHRERTADLSPYGNRGDSLRVRLTPLGGGAAQLDSVFWGGRPPLEIDRGLNPAGLEKLARVDFDVLPLPGGGMELLFPTDGSTALLAVTGRIEPAEISPEPFRFPSSNRHKTLDERAEFYTYRLEPVAPIPTGGDGGQGAEPSWKTLFTEYVLTGSGHPAGFVYGRAAHDRDHLYVTVDFTPDNTRDGEADYCQVYVQTPGGIRTFRITEGDARWGRVRFDYNASVPYEHKIYEFQIPFRELGEEIRRAGGEVRLALAAYGTATPSGDVQPAVAYDSVNHRHLVVYSKCTAASDCALHGKIVGPNGRAVVDEFPVVPGASVIMLAPAAAFDPASRRFLVVWQDDRSGHNDVYGQWLGADGTRSGTDFPLAPLPGHRGLPALANDEAQSRFLVVWQAEQTVSDTGIFGRIIRSDGTFWDIPFRIQDTDDEQSYPAAAFDPINSRFLAVWQEGPLMGDKNVYGRLVTAEGGTPQPAFPIAADPAASELLPALAYDPDQQRFLVAYQKGGGLWGVLRKSSGLPDIGEFAISAAAVSEPEVVFDPRQQRYLAAWEPMHLLTDYEIRGKFLAPDGTPQGSAFSLVRSSHALSAPALAYNAWCANFLVAYEQGGSTYQIGLETVGLPACSSLTLPLVLKP